MSLWKYSRWKCLKILNVESNIGSFKLWTDDVDMDERLREERRRKSEIKNVVSPFHLLKTKNHFNIRSITVEK